MPFTPVTSGSKMRASTLNAVFAFLPIIKLRTTDSTPVNNSTVFVDDTILQSAVEANSNYAYMLQLLYLSSATPDFKWQFTGPAGISFSSGSFLGFNAASAFTYSLETTGVSGLGGTGSSLPTTNIGHFSTTNAGTLKVQFAQNTANVSDTKLLTGSGLWLFKY